TEAVARDGIVLPSRGGGKGELLSPEDESNARISRAVCMLCERNPSNYTCPRCNLQYCGLSCYRSPDHSACSEEFYKESVLQELKDMGKTEAEGKRKMQEILLGLRQKADMTHGGMGLDINKLSEDELWELLSKEEQEKFVSLLKRGDLSRVVPLWKPWWEEHEENGSSLIQVLQEDVNEPEKGHNDEVKTSQEDDEKTVKGGKSKGSSISVNVPSISANIPKLSSLCANPSPLVCYSVVNVLYSYAFSLSLFNGDTDSLMLEFCDMTLSLSEALSSGKVFNSVQEALDCGEALILLGGYLDREDPLAPARAAEAVAHIMTGRDRRDASGYSLAALSQLRRMLSKARGKLSKEGEEGTRRQKYFQANKKCEFFQAWVKDNVQQVRRLAVELWSEHNK
uniref:Zinc finger, HIT-type containing 2 n=1 Tax=Poecilia formosa TaxID=48698 RepID=A0A087YS23_POEFO